MSELDKEDLAFTKMIIHLIWSTKRQRKCLENSWSKHLRHYIAELAQDSGCHFIAAKIVPDHMHLLIEFGAEQTVSEVIYMIKSSSAMWIRTNIPGEESFEWQKSDCGFSVDSVGVPKVMESFKSLERGSFAEEIYPLLKLNGIEYDANEVLE